MVELAPSDYSDTCSMSSMSIDLSVTSGNNTVVGAPMLLDLRSTSQLFSTADVMLPIHLVYQLVLLVCVY